MLRLLRSKSLLIVVVVCGACAYPAWSWVRAQYVTPWRHYRTAEEALARRDFPNAYKELSQCAKAWPPLLVKSESELTKAAGIPGVLGTIKRKDDTLQVTYNGQPLYYYTGDSAPGDRKGAGQKAGGATASLVSPSGSKVSAKK